MGPSPDDGHAATPVGGEARGGGGRSLVRAAIQYSLGGGLGLVASVARVAVSARVLPTEDAGIWLGLQLLVGYGQNLHFGTLDAMYRSVPLLRARGQDAEAEQERRTAFSFVLASGLFGAVGAALFGRWFVAEASARHLVATGALVALGLLKACVVTDAKASSRFEKLATSQALGAAVTLVGLVAVARFRLDGLLAVLALQSVVEVGVLASSTRWTGFGVDRAVLRAQLRLGLMTLATTVGSLAITSVDRTVILKYCGAHAAGLFYLGANVATFMPVLVAIPSTVLTPRFFERVGRGDDLTPLVEVPVRLASVAFAWVVVVGVLLTPYVIALLWPHLAAGARASEVALVGALPLVLAGLVTNVFYALDRQGIHIAVLAVVVPAAYGLAIGAVGLGYGMVGGATGAAAGLFLYYAAVATSALALAGRGAAYGAWFALRSLAPLALGLALVTAVRTAQRALPGPGGHLVVAGGVLAATIAYGLALRRSAARVRAHGLA